MKRKKSIVLLFIIFFPFLIMTLSFVFPIKIAVRNIPTDDKRDFLIITGYYPGKGWDILGDSNGMFDEPIYRPLVIEGVNPSEIISRTLMNSHFIIYGTFMSPEYLIENHNFTSEDNAIGIVSTDWDIAGEVLSVYDYRTRVFKRFITIYDLIWVDRLFR